MSSMEFEHGMDGSKPSDLAPQDELRALGAMGVGGAPEASAPAPEVQIDPDVDRFVGEGGPDYSQDV